MEGELVPLIAAVRVAAVAERAALEDVRRCFGDVGALLVYSLVGEDAAAEEQGAHSEGEGDGAHLGYFLGYETRETGVGCCCLRRVVDTEERRGRRSRRWGKGKKRREKKGTIV